MPMLIADNISKSFGGIKAVDVCSIEVERGSITGLIGPNGSGKTTLFNLITGFYRPDAGTIKFNQQTIHGLKPNQIYRRDCSYVSDYAPFLEDDRIGKHDRPGEADGLADINEPGCQAL